MKKKYINIYIIYTSLVFVGDLSCVVVAMRPVMNGLRIWFKSPLGCEMRAKQQRNLLETSIICVKSSVKYYIHTYTLLNLNISLKKKRKKKYTESSHLFKKKNRDLPSLVAIPFSFISLHTQHTYTYTYVHTYIHDFRVRVTKNEKTNINKNKKKKIWNVRKQAIYTSRI